MKFEEVLPALRDGKKVKLRDLTEEQYIKWFKDNCRIYSNCDGCHFNNVNCFTCSFNCWINHKDLYSDKFLDQEIEVEE